jgi:hypothetical protein
MLFTANSGGARTGKPDRMVSSKDQRRESDPRASLRTNDTLGYLCDIILELKNLADRSGQRTLSAILAAALAEAQIQIDKREGL